MPPDVHLLVAAHPDDEAIGFAISIRETPLIHVAYLTDGAPRASHAGARARAEAARVRLEEGRRALALLGVPSERVFALGGADQGASLEMPALTRLVLALAERLRATVLVAHPYEGGHPDHDAAALCTHAAAALRGRAGCLLVEFASYHAGAGQRWRRGVFLERNRAAAGRRPPVRARRLTAAERRLKRRVFSCYRSQATVLDEFPVAVERTRAAPRYRFLRAPHDGPLLYERYAWGMSGARWRGLAGEALATLGLDGGSPL
ncbi:MAG TPA: PIG-L family deacetylase [Polyangia bacterium]|nr:PIG-L family deacetylase [Polyangia bacterium]